MTTLLSHAPTCPLAMHRVQVTALDEAPDVSGQSLLAQAKRICGHITQIQIAQVYLIQAALLPEQLERIANELLADPINQKAHLRATPSPHDGQAVEVHYKPGVMDPVAQSAVAAIAQMLPHLSPEDIQVRTGVRYDLIGKGATKQAVQRFAQRVLSNAVVQDIHLKPYMPQVFAHGQAYELHVTHVALLDLDHAALEKLSREAHLFLSLDEMLAIQAYYQQQGRQPTDIELETLAQTWSEHCVHKTMTANVHYVQTAPAPGSVPGSDNGDLTPGPEDWVNRPGHTLHDDGSITIDNLLKNTIAAATRQLMEQESHAGFCISVFEDNAGIVRFDEEDGIAIKVETHNHPTAIEPYGGAATGIGGCIRDIMGTGLSAKPIANTDHFAVAFVDMAPLPAGVIPPKRILQQVVAGVRDYGNRMGIPTLNGSVYFDNDYVGNPLVFAGCVGIIPNKFAFGDPLPGDHIIALGGRTGRDGIHGATFSSSELTDTHADEFSHAVQIGNAITQKKTMDVILQARDWEDGPLFHAITDCGAGGFSSAVGEMGEKVGALVNLEQAPVKYAGLSYTEIWISEAQERMVLAVPKQSLEKLKSLCASEDVLMCDLGTFGHVNEKNQPTLSLQYQGTSLGSLTMHQLHDSIPTPTKSATWPPPETPPKTSPETSPRLAPAPTPGDMPGGTPGEGQHLEKALLQLLAHPNIASKHWIVRQYDHEVQGGSVIKPLVGPQQDGPSDAAVIRPKLTSDQGIAIGSGMQPTLGESAMPQYACDGDSYWMALASIDEAVRNVVCVGADPARIAILDNFCWPGCDDPAQLGSLVRAAQACYDGALAYKTPFVSGKDSLNNQFSTEDGQLITIPATLLITAVGMIADVKNCITMDAKHGGNMLMLVGQTGQAMGGSHYVRVGGDAIVNKHIPHVDLKVQPRTALVVAKLIASGHIASSHDCSDGGMLVAACEMAMAGRLGLALDCQANVVTCFAETPGRYLLEVSPVNMQAVTDLLKASDTAYQLVGQFNDGANVTLEKAFEIPITKLHETWTNPLDW